MKTTIKALAFAADKHRNQRRKDVDALPYINHPIGLADVLANEAGIEDERVLVAAILHDTVEDTETTEQELVRNFGQEVADIVAEVTDDKALPSAERKRLQIEHAPTIIPHCGCRLNAPLGARCRSAPPSLERSNTSDYTN